MLSRNENYTVTAGSTAYCAPIADYQCSNRSLVLA
jgi:hypothetical protein